jgi:hypothetical protein
MSKKLLYLLFLQLILVFFSAKSVEAATFYVSKNGTGTNPTGSFSTTNWTELNQIVWSSIQPGDTILIDGGSTACPALGPGSNCGMVYTTALSIGKSGTSVSPITVKLGSAGTVIIDGGINPNTRTLNGLPTQCPEYEAEDDRGSLPFVSGSTSTRGTGVNFGTQQWVNLDGIKWGGIEVRNHTTYGVSFSDSGNNSARYLKVHHNTNLADSDNGSVGVTQGRLSRNNTLSRSEIFRNGQDATRGGGDNFTLEENYIHHHYCNHPDGIQAFIPTGNCDIPNDAGLIDTITIRRNIFDRVGLQPIFLGENNFLQDSNDGCHLDPPNPPGHDSWVENASIHDNLLLYGQDMIKSKNGKSKNWNIFNNTIYLSHGWTIEFCCASPGAIAPMTINNNIFHTTPDGTDPDRNSSFYFGGAPTTFSNNCLYLTKGSVPSGSGNLVNTNPLFTNIATGNFSLQSNSPCAGRGSTLTSVNQLLSETEGNVGPTPTNGPTAIPTITPTPMPGSCVASTTSWTSNPFASQNGIFQVAFDATPNGNGVNSVIGLSNVTASAFSDLAASVRFNTTGFIEALNSSTYQASNPISYSSGQSVHFRMVVDIPAHTYSVYITAEGQPELLLAKDYLFRSSQATVSALGFWNTNSVAGGSSICNFILENVPGDINRDQIVNGADWKLILKNWLGIGTCSTFDCDLNNDTKVNSWDTARAFFSD